MLPSADSRLRELERTLLRRLRMQMRGGIAGARPCAYKAAGGDRYQFLPVVGFASATTRRRTDVAASDNDLVSDDSRARASGARARVRDGPRARAR